MKPHDLSPEISLKTAKRKDNTNEAIKQLKVLYLDYSRQRYPNLPEAARVVPAFTDKNTQGLTKCTYTFLKLKGCHVERTGCEGRVIDNRKTFNDVLGNVKTIGSIKRVYSSSMRGTSDLKAIINGRFVAIEIKCEATKDRQSEAQKEYQKQIETAGGVYVIATSFDQFYNWFNNTFCDGNH